MEQGARVSGLKGPRSAAALVGAEAGLDPTLGVAVLVIPPRGLGETFISCFRANPWAGGAQ